MGNALSCVLPTQQKDFWGPSRTPLNLVKSKSSRRARADEELLQQQALAMALLQQQLRLERSTSVRGNKSSSAAQKHGFSRSASARDRQANDTLVQPHRLFHDQEALSALETRHFVLVHGGGFGAWCWYKLIALLEDTGFSTTAIDLAGSGIDSVHPDSVANIEIYARPLTNLLDNLTEKVILVGHDVGGACISYAMEIFPGKIATAIFICATMITDGQRAFDAFAPEDEDSDDLLNEVRIFNYGNKNTQLPTSIEFDKAHVKEFLFNQTPLKDVALALVSLRPVPFGPLMERICLTSENYGCIARYYIVTSEDHALTTAMQEKLVKSNPPTQVFRMKGADHAPFFSKPQALHKILVETVLLGAKKKASQ